MNKHYVRDDDMQTQIDSDFDDASNFGKAVAGVIAFAFLLIVLAWCATADAQTLTFTAEATSGEESVQPKLTWSTTPLATSCTASGDAAWSGTKAGAGTETLAAINVSKTYALQCSWAGDTQSVLTWVRPTTYTNGAALTIDKYQISFGTSLTTLLTATETTIGVQTRDHAFPTSQTATVTGINTPGVYFFCVRALDASGRRSECGKRADDQSYPSKTITGDTTAQRSVAITVNPKPSPPTSVEVQ